MKRKKLIILLVFAIMIMGFSGCNNANSNNKATVKKEDTTEKSSEKEKTSKIYKSNAKMQDFDQASREDVLKIVNGTDKSTLLVDARAQENFSGWKLEGAKNGGHLKNSILFSSRWLDCEYSEKAPRDIYLNRALESQGMNKDKDVIVYDYMGKQAAHVADYLKKQGFNKVKVFKANDLIDDSKNVELYKNYDMFIPTEIVKSISDFKTGKSKELSEDAKKIVGDNIDKVVLVDVDWGNTKTSTYFSVGHVPGSVHINTDCYERPRVYVPEKRADYAKEWRLIPIEEFRDELCPQYGINKDSIVILTSTANQPPARIGFMLKTLGVKVYVMSGNLTAWKYNGYELDKDLNTLVVPKSIESFGTNEIKNPHEILWMDDVKDILSGKREGQVVDNRDKEEYDGKSSGYSYHDLAGKIENTTWCLNQNDNDGMLFENIDNTPRTKAEILSHLKKYNVDSSKTVAFFCGDSWAASRIAYVCQANDLENIKEWGQGWIPWSNSGNEFIDHKGRKVHYDKYRDCLLDEKGNDVSDGVNMLGDKKNE